MLEPFVFLAIVALYLEFPLIQDLIYTKVCLQVLSEHGFNPSANIANTTTQNPIDHVSELDASPNVSSNTTTSQPAQSSHVTDEHLGASDTIKLFSICNRMNNQNVPQNHRQEILNLNSLFWLKYQLIICTLCALSSPYWGGISDKIGRLIPLNVPLLGSILSNSISLSLATLISLDLHDVFPLYCLYINAIIVGISGGLPVLISNSFSFLSDNTTTEERTKRVTILEFVMIFAQCLGSYVAKQILLLGLTGMKKIFESRHILAFSSIIVINFIAMIYSCCRLRHRKFHRFMNNFDRERQEAAIYPGCSMSRQQTTPKILANATNGTIQLDAPMNCDRSRELTASTPDDLDGPVARADKSDWTVSDTLLTFSHYKETYLVAMKPRESRPIILMLLLSCFISALSLTALMSLFFIYVKMDPFNWSSSQYSGWNFGSSITKGGTLVLLTLCMKFYKNWSVPDPLVAAIGFLSKFTALLLIGLAQESSHLYWALACFSVSEFAMPPIRSLLSKLVIREEVCKIYSCLGSLQNICFIIGNVAFYVALRSSTNARIEYFRMAFIGSAGAELVGVLIMIFVYVSLRNRTLIM